MSGRDQHLIRNSGVVRVSLVAKPSQGDEKSAWVLTWAFGRHLVWDTRGREEGEIWASLGRDVATSRRGQALGRFGESTLSQIDVVPG